MRHPFLILVLIVIPFVAIAVALFLTADVAITIHGSDSANFYSFDLTVNPDGSGQGVTADGYGDYSYYEAHTFDFKSIQNPIRSWNNLMELFVKRPTCTHDDPSSDTLTLTFNAIPSGDLACISDQSLKAAIASSTSFAGYPKAKR
jgi:hypothetical protein